MKKIKNEKLKIKNRGFTVIEVLVAVAIIVLITAIGVGVFRNFKIENQLNSAAAGVLSVIRLAQSKTLAGEASSQWGVHFQSDRYALFQGGIYNAADPNNVVSLLDPQIQISVIALAGGGSELIFNRLTGTTGQDGNVQISSVSDASRLRTIYIESSGQANAGSAPTDGGAGRISDSRHIHFNYNRQITLASENLQLSFDGGIVVQNIPFTGNFDANNHFQWKGTIAVGGENQTLEIHTHKLNDVNLPYSVFSIYRGQNNSKSLVISISGDTPGTTLVSYTAGGAASLGTSANVSNLAGQ
ncbi:MAG: type II secretion system protein [Patescibacteria group bacterium]